MLGLPPYAVAFDCETRSRADLRSVGGQAYADHPSTELLSAGWQVRSAVYIWSPRGRFGITPESILPPAAVQLDDIAPVERIVLHEGSSAPPWLDDLCGLPWVAHNGLTFDAPVWRGLGLPEPAEWLDSLPWCRAFGLPAGIDRVGLELFGEGKDAGKDALLRLSQPAATGKLKGHFLPLGKQNLPAVLRYMVRDIQILSALCETLRSLIDEWGEPELAVVEADAAINTRGVRFDTDLAEKVVALNEKLRAHTSEELFSKLAARLGIEGGAEKMRAKLRSVPQCLALLEELGVVAPDAKRATLQALALDLDPDDLARDVVAGRIGETRVTAAKLDRGLAQASSDGRLRFTVAYHSAHTGRWGGRGMQLQNLPRPNGSIDAEALSAVVVGGPDKPPADPQAFLAALPVDAKGRKVDAGDGLAALVRASLIPDDGHSFRVMDYANIEARVLPWLAGDEDALEVFRRGGDPYLAFAAGMFGADSAAWEAIYAQGKSHPEYAFVKMARGVGKVCVLGCLGPNTEVLTGRGWTKIPNVVNSDVVWDGIAWVSCDGAVYRGEKICIKTACGVMATPDHKFLADSGEWKSCAEMPEDPSAYLKPVIPSDVGPLWTWGATVEGTRAPGRLARAVGAGRRRWLIYALGGLAGAIGALRKDRGPRRASTLRRTAHVCSNGFDSSRRDAQTQTIDTGIDTAGGGLSSDSKPWWRRSPTSTAYRGTTIRALRSTASIMTATMKRGTCVSPPDASTSITRLGSPRRARQTGGVVGTPVCGTRTSARSVNERSRVNPSALSHSAMGSRVRQSDTSSGARPTLTLPTFDVLNCGPRSRFVCRAGAGFPPVVAHNCGYGIGAKRLGEYAVSLGVDLAAAGTTPEASVEAWRDAHPLIAGERNGREWQGVAGRRGGFWRDLEAAFREAVERGSPADVGRVRVERWHEHVVIILPSGRPLIYREARIEQVLRFGEMRECPTFERRLGVSAFRTDTYGPKLVENATQAVARDVMAGAVVRLQDTVVLHVHDELVCSGPEATAEADLREALRVMTQPFPWSTGLPIAAEGFVCRRYRKGDGTAAALDGRLTHG